MGQELSAPWIAERGPSPLPAIYVGAPPWRAPKPQSSRPAFSPLAWAQPKKVTLIHDPLQGPASALDPPGAFTAPAPEGSTADLPYFTLGQDRSLTDPCKGVTLSQLA